MGIGVGAIRLFNELWLRGQLEGRTSIAEIGAQDLHLKYDDFRAAMDPMGLSGVDSSVFEPLNNYPELPYVSTKEYYKLFGLTDYTSLDVTGANGALQYDLNYPVDNPALNGRFDIVTDHGSAEHVFNIGEVYQTMHRLTKKSGIIIAFQAVINGNGYYNFDHTFFEGIAAANSYLIRYAAYIVVPNENLPGGSQPEWHIPVDSGLLNTINIAKIRQIGITYVLEKTTDAEFVFPYQGSMLPEISGNRGYELQFTPQPPSRTYVPAVGDASAKDVMQLLKRSPGAAYRRMVAKIRGERSRGDALRDRNGDEDDSGE